MNTFAHTVLPLYLPSSLSQQKYVDVLWRCSKTVTWEETVQVKSISFGPYGFVCVWAAMGI